ncbi:MAG: hypothetical protein SFW64_02420 [Alphaproteobacteria bacterium]|nr:hypothetical protein [Alphaproteobacteria bacterium]
MAGKQQTQTNEPDRSGPYGAYTSLVELITETYSRENSEHFRQKNPPIYITPYDQWKVNDLVIIFQAFPNLHSDFKSLFIDVAKPEPTELGKKDKEDAIKAMTVLSGDGDWKRYGRMIFEANKIHEENKKNGTRVTTPYDPILRNRGLLKDKTSSVAPELSSEELRVLLADNGVRLDASHDLLSPDPMAKAAEVMAQVAGKVQRAA